VGDWGGPGAEDGDGGGVDGGVIAGGHTERTKTSEKVRGVAGVRDGEGFGKVVVEDGEAKEFGSDGMGFGVVEGRETRDKKVEVGAGYVYFTPKSSTTKTKRIGRETCLKRQGVVVSRKPKVERRETRRRLDGFPASLRPYNVLSIRKTMYS
jgi:hypothetical protein